MKTSYGRSGRKSPSVAITFCMIFFTFVSTHPTDPPNHNEMKPQIPYHIYSPILHFLFSISLALPLHYMGNTTCIYNISLTNNL